MKGKRVVVTGGAGFIGSNIAWALGEDNDVVVVDNLSTGKIENIKELVTRKKVEFLRGSVTDPKLMKRALKGADYVLHHAAIASVPRSIEDPMLTNEVGITGTLTTLMASRDAGVKKVVFASSSAVYGDTKALPIREETSLGPLSPYAVTKATAEYYCEQFTRLYGLRTVSLRYFNIYGPRQDPASEYAAVIPKFIANAVKGRPLVIFGDGRQTRDFAYVEDAVQANVLAAQSRATGVFNIAGGRRITINDLASTVLEITGSRSKIKHDRPRVGDIKHSMADISRGQAALGFLPQFSLRRGLERAVEWFA